MNRCSPGLLLTLLALSFGVGCDTEQPIGISEQDTDVQIIASGAQVDRFFTWRVTEDSDGVPGADDVDGDGEAGDTALWCEFDTLAFPNSVPWTFAIEIKVLRTDSTSEEILTSDEALTPDFNRAVYDTTELTHLENQPPEIPITHARGACSGNDQILCNPASTSAYCLQNNAGSCVSVFSCSGDFDSLCDPGNSGTLCADAGAGVCMSSGFCSRDPGITCEPTCGQLGLGSCINDTQLRRFQFSNTEESRRKFTAAHRTLLLAEPNFLFGTCAGDPFCEAQLAVYLGSTVPVLGVCPGQLVGEASIDPGNPRDLSSDPNQFGLILNKGDTLIVQSRRSDTNPGGGIEFTQFPGIRAIVNVDGTELQTGEVTGNLGSAAGDPSPSISFSFTSK